MSCPRCVDSVGIRILWLRSRVEPIMLIFNPVILFCNSCHPSLLFLLHAPIIPVIFFQINFLMEYTHNNLFTDIYGTKLLVTHCYIVHPESGRSNAQNAIAFARRNRPRINRSGEFACVYLRLRARTCVQSHV